MAFRRRRFVRGRRGRRSFSRSFSRRGSRRGRGTRLSRRIGRQRIGYRF